MKNVRESEHECVENLCEIYVRLGKDEALFCSFSETPNTLIHVCHLRAHY